jgi:hypothetical protein
MFSAGMLVYGTGGRVRTTPNAPVADSGSTPVNAQGRLALTLTNPVAVYSSGVPFDAQRRVCVTADPPAGFSNGFAFSANGRLCIAQAGPITGYAAGIPRTASGAIAINNAP